MEIDGREVLYVMTFSAGLLAEGTGRPHDPLDTVMHELWHVHPACDGTIRPMRHGATFDAIVRTLRRQYLRNGGEALPALPQETRVRLRHFKNRRRLDALCERTVLLAKLVPRAVTYVCPAGHVVVRGRRLARPSSCSVCSPRFDPRNLLKEKPQREVGADG